MRDYIAEIINQLELIASRGYDISRVFSDWIDLMVLAHRTTFTEEEHLEREKDYLAIIHRYKNDLPEGQREGDRFAAALAILMEGMKQTNNELLGEVYEKLALNYKGFGQFFTPLSLCQLLAKMISTRNEKTHPTIADPCAGSGRMLVEAYKLKPEGFYFAQDIDFRCVKLCALNFLFFNMNGLVVWGDSLALQAKLAYRTIRSSFGGQLYLLTPESQHWSIIQQLVPNTPEPVSITGGPADE
ncbi:MAG: N-6 DNA methylase [Candidatus Thorarchaeota archaeon]